jgi:uncharacterized protein (TIGR02246 family)
MKQSYRNQSMVWAISLELLLAVLLAACMPIQPVTEVNTRTVAGNAEDVTVAVNAIWDEYEASIEAADADRWGDLWVDDGVKYPPDGLPLEGKAAIVNNMREWMAVATANDVAITNHTVEVAGDFAFVRGLFRVDAELKANGLPVVMDGKYMSILQRQADGSWKLYRDIFNSNMPSAAPITPAEADRAAVTAAVTAIWDEYEASLSAGDVDRWVELWSEEGIQLPPGEPPVMGKEAIRARNKAALTDLFDITMSISNEEVQVGGEWAVARGVYTATLTPTVPSMHVSNC